MFLLIGILCVGVMSTGKAYGADGLTWFEAQRECRGRGMMLINNRSSIPNGKNVDYWIGQYKDLSRWIHILGCYTASDVLAQKENEINMEIPSPGLCQANCLSRGIYIFGIQNNTCLCLKQRIGGDKQPSSRCNHMCNRKQEENFSTECGGHSSYNVFRTGLEIDETNYPFTISKHCIALQCIKNDEKILKEPCANGHSRVCQSKVNGWFYERSWRESMNLCANKSQSYLVGDVDVSNKTAACISIGNNGSSITWIGIAMQWFINFDQGQIVLTENENIIEWCKKCNKQSCDLIDCNTRLETEVQCISIPRTTTTKPTTSSSTKQPETTFTTTSTTTTKPTTSSSTKQSETTAFTTTSVTSIATNATKDEHVSGKSNDQGRNEHGVLIGILVTVAVLIVVGVVMGIIILKRRQIKIPNNVTQEGTKKRLPETQNQNYNESNNSTNNNYFVLEPPMSNYEVPDDSEQKPESPYDDGEEGTYDHLRDKESRRKTTDNVYQHAHYHQTDDSSDYDFAGRAQNQEIDNPYYDHANGHTRNSDYGYNTLDRS